MTVLVSNNAVSRLAAGLASSATTLSVMPGEGAKFPVLAVGDWCPLTVVKTDGTLEIVKVTARTGDTFTIVRAQEGTVATDFASGDRVELRLTKAVFDELQTTAKKGVDDSAAAATAASNALLTAQSAQTTANAALPAVSAANALAMADTYESVPAEFKAWMIAVTQPHLRIMVWDAVGSKYVRAQWHQPCQLFFSYDNPASISGALPVRADATWQQEQFPDVVERLGLSGSGTFTLVDTRGEGLRVLDNGRGIDTGRVLRSAQSDGGRAFSGSFISLGYGGPTGAVTAAIDNVVASRAGADAAVAGVRYTITQPWAATSEFRMRNIAFPLWMTI